MWYNFIMKNKFKLGDLFIVALVIVVGLSMLWYYKSNINKKTETTKYVSIQVDGKEIRKLKLDENMNGEKLEIKTEFGRNLLEFTSDSVRSVEADCPDKLDVLQGAITMPGETIVCLPNRLVVEIITDDGTSEIDVVN